MDPLYEILATTSEPDASAAHRPIPINQTSTANYLSRLSTLSLSDLTSNEPASLLQAAQSHVRNLQALSKRSHKAVISSATHLEKLRDILPSFNETAHKLHDCLPALESEASKFAQKYDRSGDNEVLDRRKRAMLLARNVDRVSDILELPTLLSSTVSAAQTTSATMVSTTTTSYASALDVHAHIQRLQALFPQSELVSGVARQGDTEIRNLTSVLIGTLQNPGLKLAAGMRTIGWLRRVAPDLSESNGDIVRPGATSARSFGVSVGHPGEDGALGTLFLLCRLRALHTMLEALDPLRELADQETRSAERSSGTQPSSTGTQSERYLKRYIEMFREQSFSIVSMYKSIFPSNLPVAEAITEIPSNTDGLSSLPSPVASFTLHLADMLVAVLRQYMPSVTDRSARESLLTQVLYCAGSLGRLGADFGMLLALLETELASVSIDTSVAEGEPEWAVVMKKHRIQAGRLEVLARGVGSGARKTGIDVLSPGAGVPVG